MDTTKKISALKRMAKDYKRPKASLQSVVEEYEVEITDNDLDLLHGICDTLRSGVKALTLQIKEYGGKRRVVINSDCYKAIECRCVKVAKVYTKGQYDTKADAKLHIETSSWHFPCPDYKYSNIKRNLERSIMAITGCDVEVEWFSTGIVQYDQPEESDSAETGAKPTRRKKPRATADRYK